MLVAASVTYFTAHRPICPRCTFTGGTSKMAQFNFRILFRRLRTIAIGGTAAYGASVAYKAWDLHQVYAEVAKGSPEKPVGYLSKLPTREEQIDSLKGAVEEYDVVIIGGGCMGSGIALDAVSRGLKTALIDAGDFASGTSSKSTKMVHGGARFLQKAVLSLDREQYALVKEALIERSNMINIAPHLVKPLPIVVPATKWWEIPYYYIGVKLHDFIAGRHKLQSGYIVSKKGMLEAFPMLKEKKLVGGVVSFDGQQDDARTNLALALTAARLGAHVANYVRCNGIIKESVNGKMVIRGVQLQDSLTGKQWSVRTKCLINATGDSDDVIRKMDNPSAENLLNLFPGTHIVLPSFYAPTKLALVDPSGPNGKTVMVIPWKGATIASTLASAGKSDRPSPNQKDIDFILDYLKKYFGTEADVRREDVLSAWAGVAAILKHSKKDYTIDVSDSGMVTVAGGHWAVYRVIAKDALDRAVQVGNLKQSKECQTLGLTLEGSHGWASDQAAALTRQFGLPADVAKHLSDTYGDRAAEVFKDVKAAAPVGRQMKRLHPDYPFLEDEVQFAIREEYARKPADVIARRLRLAFIDAKAAMETLPRVVELMGAELKWSSSERKEKLKEAEEFLKREMALDVLVGTDGI